MTRSSDKFREMWARSDPRIVRIFAALFALATYKLVAQLVVGPGWDTYSFMANAAALAGRGYGYTEPARPPLISVVSAPLVAMGFMNPAVIQVVDFLFVLLALVGVYVIARRRVSKLVAAGAALGVMMSPPLWEWIGVGYTDIAAVALCTWALVAVIKATEEDPRYYAVAFSLIVAAALMRTTSLLFVMPFGVWMLFRTPFFRHAKYILLGIVAAVALYLPFGVYYGISLDEPLYPFVTSLRIQQSASLGVGVYREIGSYFTSLPILAAPPQVAALTLFALLFAAWGLGWGVVGSLRARRVPASRIVAALALTGACAFAATKGGLLASQLVVVAGVYFVWQLVGSRVLDAQGGPHRVVETDTALDATIVAWLLCYYVFHESWAQRVTRYYIPMAPQVAILVAMGWNELVRRMPVTLILQETPATVAEWLRDPLPLVRRFAWLPLAALLFAGFAIDVARTSWAPDPTVVDAKKTAHFLAAQPGVHQSLVYSDMWPVTAFYLRQNVIAMPFFNSAKAVGHELVKNGAGYYVTLHPITPVHYRPLYDTGTARVLVGDGTPGKLPSVLYLGSGWENYLEQLADFRINLVHNEGDYNMQGTAFYDAYSLRQLQQFGVVAVFGGMWHDRTAAERVLQSYVEQGGTLVLDASGNLTDPTSLCNSVLFDTVIQRQLVPANASIAVDPAFAAKHAGIARATTSPWIAEGNAPWYGAGYSALPGSSPLKVYARLGGRPLIAERSWGKGRVIWFAYNLPWHAHLSSNVDEEKLIRAVLAEAVHSQPAK